MKRHLKIAVSLCIFSVLSVARVGGRMFGARRRPYLTVLYYHAVPADQAAGFARQMRQLARWARVVPADWECGGPQRPAEDPSRLVAITFDDAFESVLDNALPVLAERGFHCTIFVPTGHVGFPPSWTMETDRDRGERVTVAARLPELPPELVTIGSHTVTHSHLTLLPREVARQELEQSMRDLAALMGTAPRLFAFPYGAHDDAVVELCRACGYGRVFTIEPTPVVLADGAFARGRTAVEPSDGPLEFFLKATGSYRWMPVASAIKRNLLRAVVPRFATPARPVPVDAPGTPALDGTRVIGATAAAAGIATRLCEHHPTERKFATTTQPPTR